MQNLVKAARHVVQVLAFHGGLTAEQRDALLDLRALLRAHGEWQRGGICVVETGALMLIDPGHAERLRTSWYDRNVRDIGPGGWGAVRPISLDGEGLGVVVHPSPERATYPVSFRVTDEGIAEIRVAFIEEV